MVSDTNDMADDAEKTQPPMSALRYETPFELYAQLAQVKQLTQHRPREEEQNIDYLMRLRGSTTPEDAVTFTAFAVVPKMAIWWAYECLRLTADDLTQADRDLMERIANWTAYPDNENRYQTMQMALYAPVRTPTVFLGLAVGWSGGGIAPNDPSPVQPYRTPRAINSAVLSSLARADLNQRSVRLARFIDQSNALFQAFA